MNIRFLETLVWLTRLRSFSRTAERLNTTQPAISARMSKMEEELGVQLYRRDSREFELTSEGRQVLGYAERILDLWKETQEIAAARDVSMLKVGVMEIGTMSWLSDFIASFQDELPHIVLHVSTGATPTLLKSLREEQVDLVFVVGPVNEPGVRSDPVCSFAVDWYANPAMFACDREIDVVELSHLPIINYRTESSIYGAIAHYFETYGIVDLPMRHRKLFLDCAYSAWSGAHAVKQGLGIMMLPTFLFPHDIASGAIAKLPVRQQLPAISMTACYRQGASSNGLLQAVGLARHAATGYARAQNSAEFWI